MPFRAPFKKKLWTARITIRQRSPIIMILVTLSRPFWTLEETTRKPRTTVRPIQSIISLGFPSMSVNTEATASPAPSELTSMAEKLPVRNLMK